MKPVRKRALVSLLALGVFISTLLVSAGGVFASPTTDDRGVGNFVNSAFQDEVVAPGSTRFKFINPFTVLDTETGSKYVTKSTACGSDKMFDCQPGDSYPILGHYYFYWPNSGDALQKNSANKCISGLMLFINGGPYQAEFYAVNPKLDGLGSSCQVLNDYNSNVIPKQDLEGWGYQFPAKNQLIQLDASSKTILAGTTFLTWVSPSEIDSYNGRKLTKLTTDTQLYSNLITALDRKSDTKVYKSGYDFYSSDGCLNQTKTELLAFVAHKQGSNTTVDVVRQLRNGTYDFSTSWNGDDMACLAESYKFSPSAYWSGSSSTTIGIANVSNFTAPGSSSTGGVANGQDPTATSQTKSCENVSSDDTLAWIVCAVVKGIDKAIGTLDKQIENLLQLKPADYSGNAGLHTAWGRLRNVAYILLVPIMLVMVIGTAIGAGPFDAYTVRKSLPRMLAAVIFISLSWPITIFLIELINVAGSGMLGLISSIGTGGDAQTLADVLNPSTGQAAGAVVTTGAVFTGLIITGAFAPMIALSLALTTIVALLIGWLILILRQVVLFLLVILAPMAILPWIFPGNDKLWKLWRTSFISLLMMYPLIMLLIGAGRAFASVTTISTDSTLGPIIKIVAYIMPYFLIPATFKYAGGAFVSLAGMVNDRSRGIFDRNKKYRQGKRAENFQRAKAGELYNNRGLNAFTSRMTTRNLGFGARGGEAYQQKLNNAGAAFSKTEAGQALQHNDGALRALTYGSAQEAEQNLGKDFFYKYDASGNVINKAAADRDIATAVAAAKASGGFGRNRQLWATQQLVATGTGYDNYEQMVQTISRAAHGNTSQIAALAGNMNASTKSVGRPDLAPGFSSLNRDATAVSTGAPVNLARSEFEATGSVDAVTAMRGKPRNLENSANALKYVLDNPSNFSAEEVMSAQTRVHDLINAMTYGPEPNQKVILDSFGSDERFKQHFINAVRMQEQGRGLEGGAPGSGTSRTDD